MDYDRLTFDDLLAFFERGEQDAILQRREVVEEWRETPAGLVKAVWEGDVISSLQMVGEFKVYYPD